MLQARDRHLWSLYLILLGLLLVSLALIGGWYHCNQRVTVYIPPDLTEGMWVSSEKIPQATVYAFAYYVFQNINLWKKDGSQDYRHNIEAFQCYFTPAFRRVLKEHYEHKKNSGELKRSRVASLIQPYRDSYVKYIGNGTWKVTLLLHIREWIDQQLVKDTHINYPLRVVRFDVSRDCNPMGLALDGYDNAPQRL